MRRIADFRAEMSFFEPEIAPMGFSGNSPSRSTTCERLVFEQFRGEPDQFDSVALTRGIGVHGARQPFDRLVKFGRWLIGYAGNLCISAYAIDGLRSTLELSSEDARQRGLMQIQRAAKLLLGLGAKNGRCDDFLPQLTRGFRPFHAQLYCMELISK